MRFELSKNKYKKKVETETALKCSDFGLVMDDYFFLYNGLK
jgi:hypothetical protein